MVADGVEYVRYDLPGMGGRIEARGINDSGQVAGYWYDGIHSRAFVWDRVNGMQFLDVPDSYAMDINNRGQVAVNILVNRISSSYLWEPATGLLRRVGDGCYANGISDNGFVTGRLGSQPFLWDAQSGFRYISPDSISPWGVNTTGVVVGWQWDNGGEVEHAVIWDAQHGARDLMTFGGSQSKAYRINDTGQIVGWSFTPSGLAHACVWENGILRGLSSIRQK